MSSELSVNDQITYANTVARASIVPATYKDKPADIMIALGLGQSMGLSPAESLYRINVIQGRPTASAELIASNVRRAGHKLWTEKDEQRQSVTATIVRKDMPDHPISVTRDKEWAQSMGLLSRENYKKQLMTMLTWRAITACAREACPEALYGVQYTPDELTDAQVPEMPVEAVVEPPETAPKAKAPDVLQPLRDRLDEYREKCYPSLPRKEGMQRCTENILGYIGKDSMQELDEEDVREAIAMIDDVLDLGDTEEVPF